MANNGGLVVAFLVEVLAIVAATVGLLSWLRRHTLVSYRVGALGALGFVLSQAVHLPLNALLGPHLPAGTGPLWVTALVLGLSAGLCEELTRYALLRTAAKRVRDAGSALMFGAGHGGMEALIVALMATLALINLLLLGNDPTPWLSGLTPEERVAALSGIEQMRAVPVMMPLVGALERVMVLPIHLAATLLVTLSVVRAQRRWLVAAVTLHALLDGVTVWLLWTVGGLAAELFIGGVMVVCLALLWWLERTLRGDAPELADAPVPSGAPVELVSVSKRYGDTVQALSRATLTLSPGSRTCLLGPNGAGKTTAIRMLIGAIGASAGHAFLFGRESGDDDFLVAKRRLGVVPQLPGMYADLSVREWLELVRDVYGAGDVTAVAAELGLSTLLERPMGQLSGGQKRRVAIAAAVLAEPELLILDEPSAGLDPIASREVLDYLGALSRTHTILLCTHDLVEAERLCERVVVMLDGRVLVHEAIDTLRARIAPKLALRVVGDVGVDHVVAQLAELDLTAEPHTDELWVSTMAPERDAPRVLRALLDEGTDVLECRVVRPTLEALFLDIVRSDEATRGDPGSDEATRGDPGSDAPPAHADRESAREPMPPAIPLRDLWGATTKRLMVKEWRQLRGSGAAFWTSLLVPIFFLLVMPQGMIAGALHPPEGAGEPPPVTFGLLGELAQDPTRLAIALMPLMVTIVALIAPTSLITHAIIHERETRTLELLVALPVRIQQVIAAKLGAAFLFALTVTGVCTLALGTELVVLGIASLADAVGLLVLLVAALAYATSSSLLVAVLAKDFRTANNLAGAVIGPAIVVVMLGVVLIPGGSVRPLALALLFALGAVVLARAALRAATFERLLD